MQVSINTLSDVQYEADIEVNNEELQPHFEKAYARYRPTAEVRGFRKGKVPMAMIKKLYGEAIEHHALDTIAGEVYHKAMEEKSIHPIGQPALVDMDFKRGISFRFKIKYEVKPTIELGKYKDVAVDKPVHQVTDEEVGSEIEHLRRVNSETSEVTRVTDREHIVTADTQELDDVGTPLIGKKTTNARFLLSDNTLAPGISDALRDAEVGGEYRASFESKHGDHALAVHITLRVTKVEKVNLPPFDEAFVKKLTRDKVSSTDEFRKSLRADLERYWDEQSTRKLRDALVGELVRQHEFAIPESIVEGFLDSFVQEVKSGARGKKLPNDFNEQKFREENRSYAIWQAKWMLLKDRIAEVENIGVTDEDVRQAAEIEAARLGLPAERLLDYYKSSGSARERMLNEKVMSLLVSNARITEKPFEETEQHVTL